ncbi:hypothetical protein M0812_27535 [Anaeramoeba flamelloides]|uniref:Uncharacterized protein n=1 Tax=Anaeramoeba flamelloides TaxID=1746091 RepID=A0AAV7YB70_9EUKA|nr:hypothetical protein M0812_27535 [Anaeramoeba flamelloides]
MTKQPNVPNLKQFPVVGTFLYPITKLIDICQEINKKVLFDYHYQFYVPSCQVNYENDKVKKRWVWAFGSKYECSSDIVSILIHSSNFIPKKTLHKFEGILVKFQILNERVQKYVMKRKNGIRSRYSSKKKGLCVRVVNSQIVFDFKKIPKNFLDLNNFLNSQKKINNSVNLRKRILTCGNSKVQNENNYALNEEEKQNNYKNNFIQNSSIFEKEKGKIIELANGGERGMDKAGKVLQSLGVVQQSWQTFSRNGKLIKDFQKKSQICQNANSSINQNIKGQLQGFNKVIKKKNSFKNWSDPKKNQRFGNLRMKTKSFETANLTKVEHNLALHSSFTNKESICVNDLSFIANNNPSHSVLGSSPQNKIFNEKDLDLEKKIERNKGFQLLPNLDDQKEKKKKKSISKKIEYFLKFQNTNLFSNFSFQNKDHFYEIINQNTNFSKMISQQRIESNNVIDFDIHNKQLQDLTLQKKKETRNKQLSKVSLLFSLSNDPCLSYQLDEILEFNKGFCNENLSKNLFFLKVLYIESTSKRYELSLNNNGLFSLSLVKNPSYHNISTMIKSKNIPMKISNLIQLKTELIWEDIQWKQHSIKFKDIKIYPKKIFWCDRTNNITLINII